MIENTKEELAEYIEKLRKRVSTLEKELEEAISGRDQIRHYNEEEFFKSELRYRDGIIYGLKYAIRCNGISGGEVGEE